MKKKNAFTIIEAIVSLGVMIIIMGLGMAGILAFKNSVELQNSYADITSVIKTLQNQAKNGLAVGIDTTGNPKIPEYYILDFRTQTTGSSGYNVVAAKKDGTLFNFETNNTFPVLNNIKFETTPECILIGFQNSSANIVSSQDSGNFNGISETGSCTINITHKNILSTTKKITFDVEKNKVTFN